MARTSSTRGAGWATVLALCLQALPVAAPLWAATQARTLFGTEQFARGTGDPDVFQRTFTVPAYVTGPYTLHIVNGNSDGSNRVAVEDAVSSGRALIDGAEVVAPSAFSKTVSTIDRTLTLTPGSHTLTVELGSSPNSFIKLTISGQIVIADLTEPRAGHTATLLADGRVLIAGGTGSSGILDSAELFKPDTLQTNPLAERLKTPRSEHTATLLPETSTLLVAGTDPAAVLFTTERFLSASQTFETLPAVLRTARFGHSATLLPNGRVLILGGLDPAHVPVPDGEAFDARPDPLSAALYDPRDGHVTLLPHALQTARTDHTATLLPNGLVLVAGGRTAQGELASAELFDPATGASTLLGAALGTARSGHSATLLPDGTVLLIGGRQGSTLLNSMERFSPATQSFAPVAATLLVARADHTATLLPSGEILITGGEGTGGVLAHTEMVGPPAPDATAPMVAAVSPAAGATFVPLNTLVAVHFSEPITVTTIASATVILSGPGGAVAGTVSPGESGLLAFFVPAAKLTAGASYTLMLSGLRDLAGNPLPAFSSSFAAFPAPTITGFSPAQGAPGTVVTITGTNFDTTSLTSNQVLFTENVSAEVTSVTATSLTVKVPVGATNGPITVRTPGGTATSATSFIVAPPPTITGFSPTAGGVGTTVTISGQNFDPVPANDQVRFNGVLAPIQSATPTTLVVTVPAGATTGPITVTTLGGTATSPGVFTVFPPPTITAIAPTSGSVGTPVTISGQNFEAVPANNQVRFNGVAAVITAASTTSLTTTVPLGATSGPITVTTRGGTATGPQPFTVVPIQNFSVSAAPSASSTLQGGQASYVLTLSGFSGFAGLASLTVTGLPTGVTAQLSTPTLTAGQTGYLTVTVGGGAATGPVAFTLAATAVLDTGTTTQTVPLTLEILEAAGRTALSGQFTTVAGLPIAGVQLQVGSVQAQTDVAGNFLLLDVPAGTQQLTIDANAAVPGFPMYNQAVTLAAGQTTVLPPFRITPPPAPERFTPIANATAPQVITDPRLPGVALTLPAGASIIGWEGVPKTQIAIERLSPDQLPVPPPPGATRSVYQFFFGTPMGGMPTAPLPFTAPNDLDLEPGDQPELWYFDASPFGDKGQWKLAGLGTVSADGTKIVSNPGVGIQRFCGVCGLTCWIWRQQAQPSRNPTGATGGEPVDLALGSMIDQKTDYVLPGPLPLTLSRTYNPDDPFGGIAGVQAALGQGWALSIDPILMSPTSVSPARLILPGNSRLDFVLQADGTHRNFTHPILAGAVLSTLFAGDHLLRFKDGTTWKFRPLLFVPAGRGAPAGSLEYLIEIADRNGNRITIERGSGGVISRITDAVGRVLEVTSSGGKISQIRDPIGRTIQYQYDASGRLATVINPDGGTTRYTYDGAGRILTITDARAITFIQNFYGPSGRTLRQVQADGTEWRFRYQLTGATVAGPGCPGPACPTEDSWENLQAGYSITGGLVVATTVVDPRGHAAVTRFGGRGFTTEEVDPFGQTTKFFRDGTNQVIARVDPLGRTTSFTYDPLGNLASVTDPEGQVTSYVYEPSFNRLLRLTDPLGQTTNFEYDGKGNLTAVTDPAGARTTLAYNAFGQPTQVTGPLGHVTQFAYDAQGNPVATADPLGHRTLRAYDAVARLVALTDPNGKTTQFAYDALNRMTQVLDALGGSTGLAYDANGNLLTVTDANGQPTTYTYDPMDRLATRTDPLGRQESYQYDTAGNLRQATDRKGQVSTFTHDARNRRTGVQYADGSTTTFLYDAVGRLTSAEDSAAGRLEFTYDALDRLVQEASPQGTVAYQYDALGRRTAMAVSGQSPVQYGYDAASRLTQVQQAPLTVGLSYDLAGRRTRLTYPNGAQTDYAYDDSSRLASLFHQGPAGVIDSLSYTYDAAGNRTRVTRANAAATLVPAEVQAAYDAANQQVQFGHPLPVAPNLAYDANGNLVSQTDAAGTTTYTWDARNRLVSISGPSLTAGFTYDALGRRTGKTVNGVTTDYLYDGNDIVAEIGGGAIAATYLSSLTGDEPLVRQDGGTSEHYHTDALGSTFALTDGSGTSTASYRYEPFGRTTVAGASANPFQFTGRENDGSGLYYYRARYYSPSLHRFIREDPHPGTAFVPATLNLYAYALNDPLSYRDPSGEIAQLPPLLIAGAIFGGVGAATGAIAQGITPASNLPAFAALTTFGIANGLIAGAAASIGVPIPPAAFGAVTSGLSNLISQTLTGRKPINVGSVVGAAVGGGAGAVAKAAAQAGLAGATNVAGQALPPAVTNALGAGLGLAPQVALPAIGAAIGGSVAQP